jgi:hypothetical protein
MQLQSALTEKRTWQTVAINQVNRRIVRVL